MKAKVTVVSLFLACMLLVTVPCFANAIPNAPVVSDTLTVYLPNGTIFAQLSATEAQEGANGARFAITTRSLGSLKLIGKNLVICEKAPCNANTPSSNYSDVVGDFTIKGVNGIFLGFWSDGENGIVGGPGGTVFVVETPGVPVDVTSWLDAGLAKKGWTAWFLSDADVVAPEPASLILLGTGLLGAMGLSRRLHR